MRQADSLPANSRLKASDDGVESLSAVVLVSSLRKDQLKAAHAWLRQRADSPTEPASEDRFDAESQLIAITGPAPAVAKLRMDWSRYVQQNEGRVEVVSTSLTPAVAAALPESAAAATSPMLIQLQPSE